jgi:hypothetical protein
LAWTVPTVKKSCAIAAQPFVKIAGEEMWRDVFNSAQAAQIATEKNGARL